MALKMKRFTTLLSRTKSSDNTITSRELVNAAPDSPEANASRAVRLFCESGSASNGGEEVLHLPVIVEAAESSPSAAAACAQQIRRFLSKEWSPKPHVQYNAIMLIRILSDNPGHTFTRNFDKGFVGTVKELLRNGRDQSTQTMLRETLDSLEVNKGGEAGLQGLLVMWRKEKGQMASLSTSGSRRAPRGQQQHQQPQQQYLPNVAAGAWQPGGGMQQPYQNVYANGGAQQPYGANEQRAGGRHQLPPPFELASRIEEARNTAKILMQLIQSTPPEEILGNDLVKEFSERCQSAQKSMQGYINCDSPPPDHETMQTLIETAEQLSLASSRYQRAVLAARRAMGANASPGPPAAQNGGHMQNGGSAYSNAPSPASMPTEGGSLFAQGPPPQDQYANGTSLFAQPQTNPSNGRESYIQPSGPPQNMVSGYQQSSAPQAQGYSPPQQHQGYSPPIQYQQPVPQRGPVTVPFADPFADPVEHEDNPAPLAFEPTNYGRSGSIRKPLNAYSHPQQQRASQAFSIDSEPAYNNPTPPSRLQHQRRDTLELENTYSETGSPQISSVRTNSNATPVSAMSPASQTSASRSSPEVLHATALRPGPGPWHNSVVSSSYLGRQSSAINGLTMHGAQSEDDVAEIDSHSDVGRRERDDAGATNTPGARSASSGFGGSPVEARTVQTATRVDIAGTGGFRNSVVGRS